MNMRDKAAVIEDRAHNTWKRRKRERDTVGEVLDRALREIHLKLVACFDLIGIAYNYGESYIDGVTEKYPREGFRKHRRYSGKFNDRGGVLTGRTQPEIAAAHDKIALAHVRGEIGIGILEHMFRQFR